MRLPMVIASIVLVAGLSGCRIEVYDKLSQRDANEMTAVLISSGIDARRVEDKDGTFTVEVAEDDFATAVQIVNDSGLPRPTFKSMTDVFSDDRLISSPSEEQARLAYAMSQELSRTVSEIDGVISARVHLASPNLDPLGRRVTKSSASIAIHHESDLATDGMVPRIKLLVAHAVDDLEYDNVLVALFPVVRGAHVGSAADVRAANAREAENADAGLLNEFERPSSYTPPSEVRRSASETAKRAEAIAASSALNPAIAAILAGGLIVLLIAAKTLFHAPSRSASPATRTRRGQA